MASEIARSHTQTVLAFLGSTGDRCGMSIERFSAAEIDKLRRAGQVAAQTLAEVTRDLRAGMSTADIDRRVREDTRLRGGRPSQLGYKGFPAAVCTSRNDTVCHGIPSRYDVLEDGDIINVDVTTEVDGFHGDNSRTLCIGAVTPAARHVVGVAERAMLAGISMVKDGARMGDIGAAIEEVATQAGCTVVRDFCGHGIGRRMHAEPEVPHFGVRGRGIRLRSGMVFTIEPMINAGGSEVVMAPDGWRVTTADGSLSAQFEHTVLVTASGAEILTLPG